MADLAERVAAARRTVEQLKAQIKELKRSKANGTIATAASSRSVKQIGQALKVRRQLKGHFGKVYAMHWSGDNAHLVSASQDGKLIVWNGYTTNKLQAIPLRSSWVMTCAFEQSQNRLVACGGLDNLCSIYQLGQPQVIRATKELAAHDGYLSCCRFIDEGSIISASGDSTCIFWDVERGEAKIHFNDHGGDVMSVAVALNANRNIFVSGSCDGTAKVWDIRTGKCTHTFYGHESDINSVAFFPDGNAIGTGSDDSSCRLFDLRCYDEVNQFGNDKILCGITSVAFSTSGRLLFAGYDDYNCQVWDVNLRLRRTCISTCRSRKPCFMPWRESSWGSPLHWLLGHAPQDLGLSVPPCMISPYIPVLAEGSNGLSVGFEPLFLDPENVGGNAWSV